MDILYVYVRREFYLPRTAGIPATVSKYTVCILRAPSKLVYKFDIIVYYSF